MNKIQEIKQAVRDIEDFPSPGIIYRDITPLLQDKDLFASIIKLIADKYRDEVPEIIAGVDARGFIFGAALALELGCGFVPIRKKGKLPWQTISKSYSLEYGTAEIEIHKDAVKPMQKVLLVDDLLATGGTVAAAAALLEELEADIIAIEFVIELDALGGRGKLGQYGVDSLIHF